jgi:hypothetical protein
LNRTSTSPKEHNRGRSSSSDSSSASSCSSKRHRSVSKRSESDQISPNGLVYELNCYTCVELFLFQYLPYKWKMFYYGCKSTKGRSSQFIRRFK